MMDDLDLMSADLLDDHSELALPAEDWFDPRQPLDVRKDLGRADEDLAWVETIRLMKEQALGRRAEAPSGLKHTWARTLSNQFLFIKNNRHY